MWSLTKKTLRLFGEHDSRPGWMFVVVLIASLLEVIGISSIMPFLAVIADPQAAMANPHLARSASLLAIEDASDFALVLGCGALLLLLFSNVVLAWSNWKLMQYTYGLADSISTALLSRYVHQPFADHIRSSSADARKNLLDEAVQIVNSATVPFMQALAKIPVVALILAAVLIAAPTLSALIIVSLGAVYALVYRLLRMWLQSAGRDRLEANAQRFRVAQEALEALTDIRLLGIEARYENLYGAASRRFADALALSMTLASTPKYLFEIIAFGGILLVLLYLIAFDHAIAAALPLITLYAVAAYRLMPALQAIVSGVAKARFAEPALDLLLAELQRMPAPRRPTETRTRERLQLTRALTLRDVEYAVPGQPPILRNISLTIPARSVIGFAGSTGSGKTTLTRLLLGLLQPTRGEILVDDVVLDAMSMRRWQSGISYVPQQIYLADASVLENVAFGVPGSEIDRARAEEAARIANIHEFIATLPQGYDTQVGENGALLSGGQRQRIAIARALYRDPQLLLLDEATSALDNSTEEAVMDAIQRASQSRTIVLVAHRLNTLRQTDCIYVIERGAVLDAGTFEELRSRGCIDRAVTL